MNVNTIVDTIVQRVPAVTDPADYIGEDGRIYCGHCSTPKETVIRIGPLQRKVPCICKCGKQKRDAEDNKRNAEQKHMRIKGLQEFGLPGKEPFSWTFENDDGRSPELMKAMRNYVEHFEWFLENKKGLLLWGTAGSGKSYAAVSVANALIQQERPCLVTSFTRISNKLQGQRDKQDYLDNLNLYDLLVIDDLGVERKSEYMQEIVFDIINTRYNSGKPFIITTNLTIEEIKKPAELCDTRIYDRILERCTPIEVNGQSRRRIKAADDYHEAQRMLGLI